MNKNILTINIKKPIEVVFIFSITPENTHKWFDAITKEKIDTASVSTGTIYSSTSDGVNWSSFECVEFVENKLFVLRSINGDYCVRYDYEDLSRNETIMTYTEWMTNSISELENPFEQRYLDKLKQIIEQIV